MSLASALLEGYSVDGYMGTRHSNMDISTFLQEASVEFIFECSEVFQCYKTADIIGQTQVLMEGADPQVLLEGAVKDFVKGIGRALKKLIDKFLTWVKNVITWFKEKFKKLKSKSDTKALKDEIKKHDPDEKITVAALVPVPAGNGTSTSTDTSSQGSMSIAGNDRKAIGTAPLKMDIVLYDYDTGSKFAEELDDALTTELDNLTGLIEGSRNDAGLLSPSSGIDYQAYTKDEINNRISDKVHVDIEGIESALMDKFGANTKETVELTVGMLREQLNEVEELADALDTMTKNLNAYPKILSNLEKQWSSMAQAGNIDAASTENLNIIYSAMVYVVQLAMRFATKEQSIYNDAFNQGTKVLDAGIAWAKGGGVVTEGAGCEGDECDPDDGDDDEEDVVEEGVLSNIKEAFRRRKEIKPLAKQVDLRGLAMYSKNALKLERKKDYDGAIKGYQDYIKEVNKKKKLIADLKKDYPADIIKEMQNACDLEITLTKNYIEGCKGKKRGQGVSESALFEQAQQYLF